MSEYRDPKTGKRTAVLRGEKPELALKRLAEWNALMDAADAIDPKTRMLDRAEADARADEKWLATKREQGFRFVGWLLEDTSRTSGGPAAPGDLHVGEVEFEKDWRR